MAPSRLDKQKRLRELSHAAGLDTIKRIEGPQVINVQKPLVVNRRDRWEAQRLVTEAARCSHTLSIIHRHTRLLPHLHQYKHVEKALSDHVQNGGSPAVAQALIDALRWVKKGDERTRTPNVIDLPPGLLTFALRVKHYELMKVLAPHASSRELAIALALSCELQDHTVQSILLQYGADPNSICDCLFKLILSSDNKTLAIVVRDGIPLKSRTLKRCMEKAIEVGNREVLLTLLDAAAKLNKGVRDSSKTGWARDSMLRLAIESRSYENLLLLATNSTYCPLYDASLYPQVLESCQGEPILRSLMTEILLCLDPLSKCAASFWSWNSSPFRNSWVDEKLLRVLVAQHVPLSCHAFEIAAKTHDLDLYLKLFRHTVEVSAISWYSTDLFPPDAQGVARQQLLGRLTQRTSTLIAGEWTDEALVYAIKVQRLEWIKALLKLGASPSFNDCEAIKLALKDPQNDVLESLVSQPSSIESAAQYIALMQGMDTSIQRTCTLTLLDRSVPLSILTPILDEALYCESKDRDPYWIQDLVNKHIPCSAEAMRHLIEIEDLEVLRHFLTVHETGPFVTGDWNFLVPLLPRLALPSLRQFCFCALDAHITYWGRGGPGVFLPSYFDIAKAFNLGPVDSQLINLFGKFQRFVPLEHRAEITGIIVCSQPIDIADAFIRSFRSGIQKSLAGRSAIKSREMILYVAASFFADDLMKASKLSLLFKSFSGAYAVQELSTACLEGHLTSLMVMPTKEQWPSKSTTLLVSKCDNVDHRFYACVRIAAFHEQLRTLRSLMHLVPPNQSIGGDLLRPLLRYNKRRSLGYIIRRYVNPQLAIQTYIQCRAHGLDDLAVVTAKSASSHDKKRQCGCMLDWLLSEDQGLLATWIEKGLFSSKGRIHIWQHLNARPFEPQKHGLLAVLLRAQPRWHLINRTLVKAVAAGDLTLCQVILTHDASSSTQLANSESGSKGIAAERSTGPQEDSSLYEDASLHRAFEVAARRGDVAIFQLLIEHGASIPLHNYSTLSHAILSDSSSTLDLLEVIFTRISTKPRTRVLNECLWKATVYNKSLVCAWLLSQGASPLVRSLGPLRRAADRGSLELVEMFVRHDSMNKDALGSAYGSCTRTTMRTNVPENQRIAVLQILESAGMKSKRAMNEALINFVREPSPPMGLIQHVLDCGADTAFREAACVVESWRSGHIWLTKWFCQAPRKPPVLSHLFQRACADYLGTHYQSVDLLEVVAFILGLGVSQATLDEKLTQVVDQAVDDRENCMPLVKLLVYRGAALDSTSAKALYNVCLVGDELLLNAAMRFGPAPHARLEALHLLFSDRDRGSERDLSCFNLLMLNRDVGVASSIDIAQLVAMMKPLLLTRKTVPLLRSLLSSQRSYGRRESLGRCLYCNPDDLRESLGRFLYCNPDDLRDLLMWAITQPPHEISSSCIAGLMKTVFLEKQHDTEKSSEAKHIAAALWPAKPHSLLLLALKRGRPSLVPSMIELGASSYARDISGKSALTIAIERRYLRAVNALFVAGTDINDGSLHAAACVKDLELIYRLRKYGHTPTSRPAAFNGRTVLEIFLRHDHNDDKTLNDTVKALVGGVEKPGLWVSAPSHLSVALQSKRPYSMTVALLDNMPRQKRALDDLFLWRQRYYSPSSWVEKDRCPHLKPFQKPRLMQYLQSLGCERVYYAIDGVPQPVDAVGLPSYLLEKETDRQRRQAYHEKVCIVCGEKPDDCQSIHAPITPTCTATHTWRDDIICTDCMTGHITAQIFPDGPHSFARALPRCWAPQCRSRLNHAEVKTFLDPTTFTLYDDKLTLQLLSSNSHSARCANTRIHCPGGAWFSKSDLKDLSFFRCPVCHQLTCLQCNSLYVPSHLSKPCPVGMHRWREEENKQSEREVGKISKECGCGARIQKSEGCDHMTCNQCGREWCYDCQVPYEEIRGGDNSAHLSSCKHYRSAGRRRVRF